MKSQDDAEWEYGLGLCGEEEEGEEYEGKTRK